MFRGAISRWLAIRKTTCQRCVFRAKFRIKKSYLALLKKMISDELPPGVKDAIRTIATEKGFGIYNVDTKPVSGIGENSYGLVLQTKVSCPEKSKNPFFSIVKIAPMNPARRAHMKVADYYKREVFMYDHVFKAFRDIQEEEKIPVEKAFDAVPKMYFWSLKNLEEFIIFEDLAQSGFSQNARKNLPNFELTVSALKALARFHAMSFVLQAKRPQAFERLIDEIRYKDNLYTPNMDPITVEFAKKYVRRTKSMIAEDKHRADRAQLLQVVEIFEKYFKEIALKAVNGTASAPYSVFCHGDFWNNNILYRYDEITNKPTVAKLIDFQMSRYASPVLDVVHYFYACTEKDLRDAHFPEFLEAYYDTLSSQLRLFQLDPNEIYPRAVLDSHLKSFGPYGFCMAIFAVPFFISDSGDLPDLDEVSEAINELSSDSSDAEEKHKEKNNNSPEILEKSKLLIDEYEMLNEKTIPVFKRRLIGVVKDLFKYGMVEELIEFAKKLDEKEKKEKN